MQDVLDKTRGDLKHDINAFAEPLLKTALQAKFKAAKTSTSSPCNSKYPVTLFVIDTGASRVRQSTLLEAALHNLEEAETAEGELRNSSGIYRKDQRGSLGLEPAITLPQVCSVVPKSRHRRPIPTVHQVVLRPIP